MIRDTVHKKVRFLACCCGPGDLNRSIKLYFDQMGSILMSRDGAIVLLLYRLVGHVRSYKVHEPEAPFLCLDLLDLAGEYCSELGKHFVELVFTEASWQVAHIDTRLRRKC